VGVLVVGTEVEGGCGTHTERKSREKSAGRERNEKREK